MLCLYKSFNGLLCVVNIKMLITACIQCHNMCKELLFCARNDSPACHPTCSVVWSMINNPKMMLMLYLNIVAKQVEFLVKHVLQAGSPTF